MWKVQLSEICQRGQTQRDLCLYFTNKQEQLEKLYFMKTSNNEKEDIFEVGSMGSFQCIKEEKTYIEGSL